MIPIASVARILVPKPNKISVVELLNWSLLLTNPLEGFNTLVA